MNNDVNKFFMNTIYRMRFRPRYGNIVYHKHHMKGTGMGDVLLNKGGSGSGSSYSSVKDYEHTMNGKGLANKLEKLVMKQPTLRKPKNIMLNL